MSDDGLDLPEFDHGSLGETVGGTLLRVLDNVSKVEASNDGAQVQAVVVATVIQIPPSEGHENGRHVISVDHTPGIGYHVLVGILHTALDDIRD